MLPTFLPTVLPAVIGTLFIGFGLIGFLAPEMDRMVASKFIGQPDMLKMHSVILGLVGVALIFTAHAVALSSLMYVLGVLAVIPGLNGGIADPEELDQGALVVTQSSDLGLKVFGALTALYGFAVLIAVIG